jgi:hypothetical protein
MALGVPEPSGRSSAPHGDGITGVHRWNHSHPSAAWRRRHPKLPLIPVLDSEVQNHNQFGPDLDLAYAADLTKRLQTGMIVSPLTSELQLKASEALKRASKVYPAVEAISPTADGPPQVGELVSEIKAAIPAETDPVDDDIPF